MGQTIRVGILGDFNGEFQVALGDGDDQTLGEPVGNCCGTRVDFDATFDDGRQHGHSRSRGFIKDRISESEMWALEMARRHRRLSRTRNP